jgi:streptomycin 6-kinase
MSQSGNPALYADYLKRWQLTPDGEPIVTPTSRILPVRVGGMAAMLKIASIDEERIGNRLMAWWNGAGAARVLAADDDAILMERAEHGRSLAHAIGERGDDAASRTICAVLAKLHAAPGRPSIGLPFLAEWFEPLGRAARAQGGLFRIAAAAAADLLADEREAVVLHGDVHHGNVLDFGARGWLAIDPKGLVGERGFDYANIFCNPDDATAARPGRLARQADVVAEAAHLERSRLLAWVVAWAGLSAAFALDDGLSPDGALRVAEMAAAERGR